MKEDIAAAWAHRLRTGGIVQRQGYLGDIDGARCCLGVLCDMAVEARVIAPPHAPPPSGTPSGILYYDGQSRTLPPRVQEWAGMTSETGYLPVEDSLAGLNDNYLQFDGIADVIERLAEAL